MSKKLTYKIEKMTGDDVEAVAAIEQASFDDPWSMQSFQTELEQNTLAAYYVARLAGKVIAYVGAWMIIDEAHITTLAVAEPYRCHGIATDLLKTLIAKARDEGVQGLTLEVRPSNTGARIFYEKQGFNILGRRKRYYQDEDALIMARENLTDEDS